LHSGAGVAEVSYGGFLGSDQGEAGAGHIGVDGFVLDGGDLVGFVPDADGAVIADVLIEVLPGGSALLRL